MTASTTHAHELLQVGQSTCKGNGMIGGPSFYAPDEGGEPCPDCCPELTPADLETRALGMLTDDQAMASFIRWRTALHGAKAVRSIRTAADVSEYVNAIFEKVPG